MTFAIAQKCEQHWGPMTQSRLSPDDRTPTEDESLRTAPTTASTKPPDNSRWQKAADTWTKEAEANIRRAVQYYANAADYYRKAHNDESADQAMLLSKQLKAVL